MTTISAPCRAELPRSAARRIRAGSVAKVACPGAARGDTPDPGQFKDDGIRVRRLACRTAGTPPRREAERSLHTSQSDRVMGEAGHSPDYQLARCLISTCGLIDGARRARFQFRDSWCCRRGVSVRACLGVLWKIPNRRSATRTFRLARAEYLFCIRCVRSPQSIAVRSRQLARRRGRFLTSTSTSAPRR